METPEVQPPEPSLGARVELFTASRANVYIGFILGSLITLGGLGVAASGNIGRDASVFEPVHGSAPALVGTGKANPIATFLAAAMMLEYLNEKESAAQLRNAVQTCIANNESTPDLDGNLTTNEVTEKIIGHI